MVNISKLNSTQIENIKIGQQAFITVDAYPSQKIKGELCKKNLSTLSAYCGFLNLSEVGVKKSHKV